jgi:putative hydrolase of the HAD superfamily
VNIKSVIFDVDDTLFDRVQTQVIVLEIIAKRFPEIFGGFDMPRLMEAWLESDRIATMDFETNTPSNVLRDARSREFLRILGISQDYVTGISRLYYDEYPSIYAPVPGAIDLVQKLSRVFKTGIVSNSFVDVQHRKLDTLGIRSLFSCIVLSEEIGIRKPDPRIFHHAAALLQTPPSECLYVGDSYKNDIAGSRAAGMLSCWFKRGDSSQHGQAMAADFEIKALNEIGEILC